jgi:glycosyltransferase involved in cell wall biosynthesis/nucleotide-binding universal stress UspA family protein
MQKNYYPLTLFRKVLVPVLHGCPSQAALSAAYTLAGEGQVLLVGIVSIAAGASHSVATGPAREIRKIIHEQASHRNTRVLEPVRVSQQPWETLRSLIEQEKVDLCILEWSDAFNHLGNSPADILAHPPCDLVLASGMVPACPSSVLVALRGGPFAELSLRVSLAISQSCQSKITTLHMTGPNQPQEAPFRGIEQVLENLPEVEKVVTQNDDPASSIVAYAQQHPLVILGASARPDSATNPLGPVAQRILENQTGGVLVVKSRRPAPVSFDSPQAGQNAISVLVDQWFAENTYHSEEFADINYLLTLKQRQGTTISLALPALNEEKTVGNVIRTIKSALMDDVPLLDEIVLIDSNSRDRTREIAEELGVPVYIHQEMLPQYGPRRGKGEALWKSLYATSGDIILWIDTDIVNVDPRFVYGLIGPLLQQPEIKFIKGFYRRPLKVDDKIQAGGGGRVTELTARPLINLFYPEISGIIQPLAGEYGGRREALEQLPFFSGYGVEIGLLIDMLSKFGLQSIAQVDLHERVHHNQSLESLSKMSFAIIQAVIRKLEEHNGTSFLEDVNRTMKLIRYEPGHFFLDVEEISEPERPAMIMLEEYRQKMMK